MTPGLAKNVHQPLVLISAGGRNDVTNRPKVGIVHRIARMMAIPDAQGEDSFVFASWRRSCFFSCRDETFFSSGVASVVIGSSTAEPDMLIAFPPKSASAGRCRR